MQLQVLKQMKELISKLPVEDQAKQYEMLLDSIIEEKEQKSSYGSKGGRGNKKGSTKKKSETSETTTHTTHTTEVKEKNEFEKTLDEFIKMRKAIKKPITEEGIKLVKQKLEKMYPGNQDLQIQVLQNSISNSWQGIFPLKEEEKTETKSKYNPFEDLSGLSPR